MSCFKNVDSDDEIQHCITFDNEVMCSVNNSEKGRLTIEKYNLNSTLQQLQCGKWLGRIKNEILALVKCSGANCLTENEQEHLRAYTYPSAQYSYMAEIVRQHPISWNAPTTILYGSNDNLTSAATISNFAKTHNAALTIMQGGEHWFHTDEQMRFLDDWILNN